MNSPTRLSLDSVAAIAVLTTGLVITAAWGVESALREPSLQAAAWAPEFTLTPDGRMKLTVTAQRLQQPEAKAPVSASVARQARPASI